MKNADELLTEVMSIASVNGRDDEGAVAEYLRGYFAQCGITAETDRIDRLHANVTAYIPGKKASAPILWNGHLDTVPYGNIEEWNTDPAVPVLKDGKLYGRGASDMKSGLCAMVYALCESRRKGIIPEHPIVFAGTCDEEKGGIGARRVRRKIRDLGIKKILIGEPTDLRIGSAQKGCLWLKLTIDGKTSHAAYPEQGASAVTAATMIHQKLEQTLEVYLNPLLGTTSCSITQIKGGVAPNMIPDSCEILLDIRFTPDLTEKKILACLEGVTSEIIREMSGKTVNAGGSAADEGSPETGCAGNSPPDPLIRARIEVVNSRRAVETGMDCPLSRELSEAMRSSGLSEKEIGIHFFTDASVIADDMTDAEILLFGPGLPSLAHKPNEYVSMNRYRKAIEVLEHMIGSSDT